MKKGEDERVRYTKIYHDVRVLLGLSCNEYCVADTIDSLSGNRSIYQGWCYKSKENLAKDLGLSRQSVIKMINKLEKLGLVERKDNTNLIRTTQLWFESVVVCKESYQSSKESLQGVSNKFTPKCKESLHNITTNTNSNINNINSEVPSQELSKEISQVIDAFNLVNDDYKKFFNNKTQRKAVSELIESKKQEQVLKAIYLAKFCYSNKFFPHFVSPSELQHKWPKIKKFYATKKSDDKRFTQEFEKYVESMEKERLATLPKRRIPMNIGGRTLSIEVGET